MGHDERIPYCWDGLLPALWWRPWAICNNTICGAIAAAGGNFEAWGPTALATPEDR